MRPGLALFPYTMVLSLALVASPSWLSDAIPTTTGAQRPDRTARGGDGQQGRKNRVTIGGTEAKPSGDTHVLGERMVYGDWGAPDMGCMVVSSRMLTTSLNLRGAREYGSLAEPEKGPLIAGTTDLSGRTLQWVQGHWLCPTQGQ